MPSIQAIDFKGFILSIIRLGVKSGKALPLRCRVSP
jgi:hypothetical protein